MMSNIYIAVINKQNYKETKCFSYFNTKIAVWSGSHNYH